jgi:hypothetical protein
MRARPTFLALAALLVACADEPVRDPAAAVQADSVVPDSRLLQYHERNVAFLTPAGDSTLSVHWVWESRARTVEVDRQIRGSISRNGTWEQFITLDWETPPSRSPWRILPRRPVRLVMGQGEAVERILYAEGGRQMEVIFGSTLAEWTTPRGESVRIQEGQVELAGRAVDGLLLDLIRSRLGGEDPGGDWVVLASGSSLQLVLEDPAEEGSSGLFRGWARYDFQLRQWPEVEVSWTEQRPFEPARRDIPAAWALASRDGELAAELTVRAAQLEAVPGQGPILPVRALFEVEGAVRIDGRELPVRGLWSHVQR